MRSSHSLAFRQFEEVLSEIKIEAININNEVAVNLLKDYNNYKKDTLYAFQITWISESNWNNDSIGAKDSGKSILIAIPASENSGLLLRSLGYSEKINATSTYKFLSDNTFLINTPYNQTIAEERIWFISNNVRCRSSVIFSKENSAILQTAYASEVRNLKV